MARKEKKSGPPTMSLVFVGLACFFVAAAGAGFLWNKSQIHTLGEQIRGYEIRLDAARRHRMTLERTYASMCSRADLDARVKRMRIELGPPQPDQIVRLWETPGATQEEKLLAGRTAPSLEARN
jgi:hypothetical protein